MWLWNSKPLNCSCRNSDLLTYLLKVTYKQSLSIPNSFFSFLLHIYFQGCLPVGVGLSYLGLGHVEEGERFNKTFHFFQPEPWIAYPQSCHLNLVQFKWIASLRKTPQIILKYKVINNYKRKGGFQFESWKNIGGAEGRNWKYDNYILIKMY